MNDGLQREVDALRAVNEDLRARLAAIMFECESFALPGDDLAALTATERAIAKLLFDRAGSVVRKTALFDALYALRLDDDQPDLKIIDVLVCSCGGS